MKPTRFKLFAPALLALLAAPAARAGSLLLDLPLSQWPGLHPSVVMEAIQALSYLAGAGMAWVSLRSWARWRQREAIAPEPAPPLSEPLTYALTALALLILPSLIGLAPYSEWPIPQSFDAASLRPLG